MRRFVQVLLLVLVPVTVLVAPSVYAHEDAVPLTAEQVRLGFERNGYDVDTPIYWSSSRLSTLFVWDAREGSSPSRRVVLVLVYPDVETAFTQHRMAHLQEEADTGLRLVFNLEQGPQLLPGYGRSSWWHNVALVQATRPARSWLVDATDAQVEPVDTAAIRRAQLAELNSVDGDLVRVLRGLGSLG
jgi:hypothetical protein